MRIGVEPENLAERAVLAMGQVPTPLLVTHPVLLLARALMVATKYDMFEVLAPRALDAAGVANRCGTHAGATKTLLETLAKAEYVGIENGRFLLTPLTRRWLLKSSPRSLRDSLLFRFLEWDWIARLDDFIKHGTPLDFHAMMSTDEWQLYQRGMRSLARLAAPETVRRVRVPKGARRLLDVGGSHGYLSVVFCRRYPQLRAEVLDLPAAVEHAAPLLGAEDMGDRVVHRVGDARTEDLGHEVYDVILLAQLVHHFDAATNRDLVARLAHSLRPGGVLVVQEISGRGERSGQLGGLSSLYFALTSHAGSWSFEEIASWQSDAGLIPRKPLWFRTLPDTGQQVAVKPS